MSRGWARRRKPSTPWSPKPKAGPACRPPIHTEFRRRRSALMSSQKSFPVTWDQFHRDSRALAWRLTEAGPFEACVAITRGGLVPAAIVARELNIRTVDCVAVKSYDHQNQGSIRILKAIDPEIVEADK